VSEVGGCKPVDVKVGGWTAEDEQGEKTMKSITSQTIKTKEQGMG